MSKKFKLYFSGNLEHDTDMIIEIYIEQFGSQFKGEIVHQILEDIKSARILESDILNATVVSNRNGLQQKLTKRRHHIKCLVKALSKIFNKPDLDVAYFEKQIDKQPKNVSKESTPKNDNMTPEEMEAAMVDIGLGRTWETCRIENKTETKKKKWDILKKEIEEGWDKGYGLDIPTQ